MQGRIRRPALLLSAAAMLAALDTAPALAQGGMEEIVVTATRRTQALQDVPIAVSAISGEDLDRQNVVSAFDLQRVAPSLVISNSTSETGGSTVRVRGVGTTGNNTGLEGAVGIFIDGVYRQRPGLALQNLVDVARVEVLRGPQGTLFGKNTSAGALTITPNLPKFDGFHASIDGAVGNYGDVELGGMLNTPVGDKAAFRIAGTVQKRDGILKDTRSGADYNNRRRGVMRAMLLTKPVDNWTWRITLDYGEKDEKCCTAPYRLIGASARAAAAIAGVTINPNPFSREVILNSFGSVEKTQEWGMSSHLNGDLGWGNLGLIVAHREFRNTNIGDVDNGPADIVNQVVRGKLLLTSAELTLNGQLGQLDWLVGGFYADEQIRNFNATVYGADTARFVGALIGNALPQSILAPLYPVGGGNVASNFSQNGTSWSIFTHDTYKFTDAFSGTIGLRYNSEKKDGGAGPFTVNSPSCSFPLFQSGPLTGIRTLCPRPAYQTSISEEQVTGTGNLAYKFNENVNAYASYSHGYKAGGINLDRDATVGTAVAVNGNITGTQAQINAAAKFNPEFSNSWEAGLKTEWLNKTVTVNTAFFLTDYKDFQLNTFNGLGFTISNAGTVKSKGVELESSWAPNENWFFTLGGSFIDAIYGNDPGLRAAGLAGRQLTNAPKWTVLGSVTYERPLTEDVTGFLNVNGNFRSKYSTGSDLDPLKAQDGFTLWGGRIGVRNDKAGWEGYVFGENIFNKGYHNVSFNSVFQAGSISSVIGTPAFYGLRVKKKF